MDINDIKKEAALAANTIDINWESLDNPTYRRDFEAVLKRAALFVPELENLHLKLSTGESVAFPDEPSSLNYEDMEKYSKLVEEELFNGYILQEIYHKYECVNAVMKAALDNEA